MPTPHMDGGQSLHESRQLAVFRAERAPDPNDWGIIAITGKSYRLRNKGKD